MKNKLNKIFSSNYHLLKQKFRVSRRMNLKNRDFTILSNDCAGGYIYQYFGLPYRSPTAGLFFTTEDYLKLAKDPICYLKKKLEFIDPSRVKNIDLVKNTNLFGTYPIGKLGDIEIFFMHYGTKELAAEKWYKRVKRINFENFFLLLTENEFFSLERLQEFDTIPTDHKICLTHNKYEGFKCVMYCKEVAQMKEKKWSQEIVVRSVKWKQLLNDMK